MTFTVKDHVPRFDGVPAITPVVAFSESPGGSVPDAIDQVNGALPPDTATAAE
jgi:hypothetical protein